MNTEKPWWVPHIDTSAFLAMAIVFICAIALFYRMSRPSVIDDKMLETMLTILFSTCLVSVYNYSYGSSRGSAAKDEVQNKMVEKLVPNQPTAPSGDIKTENTTVKSENTTVEVEKPKTDNWSKP